MKTADFDYHLPRVRIAQASIEPRDHSRMLVVDCSSHVLADHHFFDLPTFLRSGDLIVWNDTKVFRARLHGRINECDVELFLLRVHGTLWHALIRPSKHISVGATITVASMPFFVEKKRSDGTARIRSPFSATDTIAFANRVGSVPTPPYIDSTLTDDASYQTIYAKQTGSVAAPTSGFHFTESLVDVLNTKGVQFASVTLHVGLGTFQPITTDTLEAHPMHSEWTSIPQQTVDDILCAKQMGRRVIAVGTTTTRALEGAAQHGELQAWEGDVNLFIKPGKILKNIPLDSGR